jgi:hypothetical protein
MPASASLMPAEIPVSPFRLAMPLASNRNSPPSAAVVGVGTG